jgi:hypothetical protein
MRKRNLLSLLFLCSILCYFPLSSQVSLVENFDGGLNGWTGTYATSTSQTCAGSSPRDNIFTAAGGNFLSPNQAAASNGTDISVSFDYKIVDWSAATNPTPAGWGTASFEFSTDGGGTWTSAILIDDSNHVTSAVCSTVVLTILGADVPMGSDVQFRLDNTYGTGDYYFYFDEFSATQVATNPPNCDAAITSSTTDFPLAGTLTWSAATGAPTGYFLSVGSATGGTDIVNNVDVGLVTSYDLSAAGLMFSTDYFVNIIPYNAVGSATVGCTEEMFTTEADPNSVETVTCGTPFNTTHCYTANDVSTFTFTSSDGTSPLQMTFNAGTIENCCDDIAIYEGTDNTGTLLYSGNNSGDLTGLMVSSAGPSLFLEIDSDGSVQCDGSATYAEWDWDVECLSCTPAAGTAVVGACDPVNGLMIDVDVTGLGDGTVIVRNDQGVADVTVMATGVVSIGDFAFGDTVIITLAHPTDVTCDVILPTIILSPSCPPSNDDCANAIMVMVNPDLSCTLTTPGTITSATPSSDAITCGGTADDDVWFSFVATSTDHEIELQNPTGTTTDLYHGLYSGMCGSLTEILCSDPNTSTITGLTIGDTYYLRVYTWTATPNQAVDFDVCIGVIPPPPPNDTCGGALDYTMIFGAIGSAGTCPGNMDTLDLSLFSDAGADPVCEFGGDALAWYTWTATETGISFTSGTGLPGLEILEGPDCDNLTSLACFNNVDGEYDGLTIGTTYYFAIWDDGGGVLSDWCIEGLPACAPPMGSAVLLSEDCPTGTFMIEVDIDSLGSALSIDISNDAGVASTTVTDTGQTMVGPFPIGTPVIITLEHDSDTLCDLELAPIVDSGTCPPTCGEKFYDTGGAAGNYSSGESNTWLICPSTAGDLVTLTFNAFEIEGNGNGACWDAMKIYDGMDATAPIMSSSAGNCWQSATDGTEYPGGALGTPVTATNASGCLYIEFTSDGSVTGAGWDADVTCAPAAAACGASSVTLAGASALANTPDCQSGPWTYYGDGTNYYFAIEKYPTGGNTAFFEPVVDVNVDAAATSVDDGTNQTNTSPRYWNVDLTRGTLNGDVNIRFYYDPAENMALEATSLAWAGSSGVDNGLEWFKTVGANFDPAVDVTANGVTTGIALVPSGMGMENGIDYVEFAVSSFSGGGATTSARNSPLPIELVSFTGEVSEKENILSWEVAQEINVSHYEVLRSLNGMDRWEAIGKTSAFGNSNEVLNYTIKDQQPKAKAYYRLLSVDFDGKTQLSDRILLERLDNKFKLHDIYPIPTKDVVNLQFETKSDSEVRFTLTDVSGKVLLQRSIEVSKGLQNETINLDDYPSGLYFLQIENDGDRIVERIVKN